MNSKKIGNNYIISCGGKKHVLGAEPSLVLFISNHIGMFTTVAWWILSCNFFYHYAVYIVGIIIYFVILYYSMLCFFTEPGIIPKEHPLFQLSQENTKTENAIDVNILQSDTIDQSQKIIPSIFTERYCETCKIIRPPKASHCGYCDNCVLDFDHHCLFVSNCIGERNYKYFFLFLLYGTIEGIYITSFNIGHIAYVFLFYEGDNIISVLFKQHLWLMIIACVLIAFTFAYLFIGSTNIIIAIPAGIGYMIIIILFYVTKSQSGLIYPYEYNPFSIFGLATSVSFGIFVSINCCKVTNHICQGYTIKQMVSIQREVNKSEEAKEEINEEYLRQRSFKEKMINIYQTIMKTIPKSLIETIDLD